MLDIHSHILPYVDDGSKDMDESIEMARIYLNNGINQVIATPHYIEGIENSTKDENLEILDQFRKILREKELDLQVYLGNEIYITLDTIKHIESGNISTLNNSKYVLIELPMLDIPLYTESLIYELLLKGHVPIIAHPERNARIIEDPNILYRLIERGALAQLNLPSIEGSYGGKIRNTGEILLRHNMIHLVGTDAHSKGKRAPNVKKALGSLREIVDEKTYRNITYLNAISIVNNGEIIIKSPMKYSENKSFFVSLKEKLAGAIRI